MKKHKLEESIGKLCGTGKVVAQGGATPKAWRHIGVTEQAYYRWPNGDDGLKGDVARQMKEVERKNKRVRRAVSDRMLDKWILQARSAREHHHYRATCQMPRAEPVDNIWQFMRDNWLSNSAFTSHNNITEHCY